MAMNPITQKVYRPAFLNLLSYGRKVYMLYTVRPNIPYYLVHSDTKTLPIADYRFQFCKYNENIDSIAFVYDDSVAK